MEYYSALKKKEILRQMIAWVSLGDIVLSKMSPSQKTNTALFQVLAALGKIITFMDSKSGMVAVYQEMGREGSGQEVSLKQDRQTTDIEPIVNSNFLNACLHVC